MPLTRDGELKFVASSDLKGLGAKEGPPVSFRWTRPSVLPPLLPWLAVLILLVLRPNRTAQAWWIWLPLGIVLLVEAAARTQLAFLPSGVIDLFCQVARALGFGLAAVWLAAPFLGSRFRFVAFLKLLVAQGVIGALVWALSQDWSGFGGEQVAGLVCLGILSLVLVGALCLAGFNCRRGFRPARFLFWLVLWLLAGVALTVLPFAAVAAFAQGPEVWAPYGISILIGAGISFCLMLPFLVLCFANRLYRERLRDLLRMETVEAPPALVPAAAPVTSF